MANIHLPNSLYEWIEFSVLMTGHFYPSNQTMWYKTRNMKSLVRWCGEEHSILCCVTDIVNIDLHTL
jgi:hypothetical protein